MATIRDVAKEAGVSIATVSRALNGNTHLAGATRQKVLAAADKLGYQKDRLAAAMRTGRTGAIGLVLGDVMNPFYAMLAHCVERAVHSHQASLVLSNAHEDGQSYENGIQALVKQGVDGLLVVPPSRVAPGWKHPDPPESVAMVALDREAPGAKIPSVVIDSARAMQDLGEHLRASGYRHPAYLAGPEFSLSGQRRTEKLQEALANCGFGELEVEYCPHDAVSAASAARALLSLYRPDIIICASNQIALGVLMIAKSMGMQLGSDLGLVAIDDIPWFSVMSPAISVIDQPVDKLANLGVTVLMKQIFGASYLPKAGDRLVAGEGVFISRESTQGPQLSAQYAGRWLPESGKTV